MSIDLPYRPGVGIMLVNPHGHVFVGQRFDSVVEAWQMPQGGIDPGEDPYVAALRELEEEMGITGVPAEEIGSIPPSERTGWEHVRLFLSRWDGTPKFPCAEIEAVLWMPPDGLDAWISKRPDDFASGFLECWKHSRGR